MIISRGLNNANIQSQNVQTSEKTPIVKGDIRLLQAGQVFEAEILDIRNAQITIRLNNQQKLIATLLEQLELTIGQTLTFEVKENNGEQIMLKPMIDKLPIPAEQTVLRALEAAGLPVNERTVSMVRELINQQQPIDKNTLLKIVQNMYANKEANIEDIVLLNKLDIPVNKTNLNQIDNYRNYEHRIVKEIDNIIDKIPETITTLTEQVDSEEAITINNKILDTILHNKDNSLQSPVQAKSQLNVVLSNAGKNELLNILEHLDIPTDIKDKIIQGEINTTDILKELEEIILKSPKEKREVIKQLINSEPYKELVKEELKSQWLLRPQDLKEEQSVAKLYNRIYKQIEELQEIINTTDKTNTDLINNTQGIKENIDFMKSLNEMFTYLQIPIKLKNQNIHSDLYVFTDKKDLKKNKDNISVLLHLDLSYLGLLDIYINKQGNSVYGQFFASDEDTKAIIGGQINTLVDRLNEKGYSFYPQLMDKQKDIDFVKDFLEQGQPDVSMKRYSFDIRV